MNATNTKRERKKARRAERIAAERAAAKRQQMLRRARVGLLALLVVGAIVAAALFMVRGADATLGVPAPEVSGEAPSLPPPPAEQGAEDPAVGSRAPQITGYDPDGEPVQIGGTGQPQALSFLAHWCPHCQAEVPEVVEWVEEGNLPSGVDLVAVSTQHDPARPNWPPDRWLADEGWQGPVLVDHDLTASEAYGARGTPFWVFVDGDGTVVARHPGRLTLGELADYVDALERG